MFPLRRVMTFAAFGTLVITSLPLTFSNLRSYQCAHSAGPPFACIGGE
jgi:hypothetical protein